MLFNYIKIAFRNMIRNKTYSFINITGLAIGMAACILILLWVQDELSYDKFHENADDIYRIVENQYYSGGEPFPVAVTPGPLAKSLKDEFPEVKNSVRLLAGAGGTLKYGEKIFTEKQNAILTEQTFFEIFSFSFIKGNPETALVEPNSIVLSEKLAEKYFPSEDPLGKILILENKVNLKVTGVIKNIPDNSHLRFDFAVSINVIRTLIEIIDMEGWGNNAFYTYVQLQNGTNYQDVSKKISGTIKKHAEGAVSEIFLQPLTKIHLYSAGRYTADIDGHGDILYVNLFSIIAIFVLLIACINFMNLATAKSINRAKEIGIRKVVGASRQAIIRQFLGESIIYSLLALLLALVFVELLLPAFTNLTQKDLALNFHANISILLALLLIAVITGIVSGSYPALFLSSFKPATVLKSSLVSGKKGAFIRKSLVVFQFSLSVILIIGTAVVYKQLDYIHKKNLGLSKENITYIPLGDAAKQKYETIKKEFLNNPEVEAVTVSSHLPTYMGSSTSGISWEGKNPNDVILLHYAFVDQDYVKTFKMEIAEGRFYSEDFASDSNALVINEEAANLMGRESIIGKKVNIIGVEKELSVIGVLKNFHFKPLNTKIEPMILSIEPSSQWINFMFIRIKPGNPKNTLASLEKTFKRIIPETPFEYQFLDQDYENMYRGVERMGSLFMYFSILAIFISCLGLFGLASFIAERRTKEIGVRKVLGASVLNVVMLLSKEFTKWVLLANLIAWPIAYYAMAGWLENFAYRIDMSWWLFVGAACIALAIALMTVGYHAVKAALTDPVKALRYE